MICGLCLLVVLLHQTVLASVCHKNISQPSSVVVSSPDIEHDSRGSNRCVYVIEAPEDSSIVLTFSQLHGFAAPNYEATTSMPSKSSSSQDEGPKCLPRVEIQEMSSAAEADHKMLPISNCHPALHAFLLETNRVKIIFQWRRHHTSGFTLVLNFKKPMNSCETRCQDGTCLAEPSLVCNGHMDCLDQSDEVNCIVQHNDATIHVIVIVIVVICVVMVVVIICLLRQYSLVHRLWTDHRQRHASANSERNHLQPHTPTDQHSEVVYVQQQQQAELEVAREREHQRRLKGLYTDIDLNLPVSVCRSKDGEEGYASSQRQLQHSNNHRDSMRNCIVAPPNKTLYQGESPPPYRSHSVGGLDRHSSKLAANRTAVPSTSPTQIPRCHTMSAATDNNNRLGNLNLNFTPPVAQHGGGPGGGGGCHGVPHSGPCHGNNNTASLSLSAGAGIRRTARLASSPAAMGRSRHRSSTSSNQSTTSNVSVGSGPPAFDPPPEYSETVNSSSQV